MCTSGSFSFSRWQSFSYIESTFNSLFRVFAKITLSYGADASSTNSSSSSGNQQQQQAPRSAALDLLLYDSLCWDCTLGSGECKAVGSSGSGSDGKGKCFFAAGASPSSIQVFRIGRTITTKHSQGE